VTTASSSPTSNVLRRAKAHGGPPVAAGKPRHVRS
jgi:hypothetical protein